MIYCKKTIIAACFTLMLPLVVWSEAPVVDDSDNFAIIDGQQMESSVAHSKYDESQIENTELDGLQNENYQMDNTQDDEGPALVPNDKSSDSHPTVNDSATLIDKFQALQHEIQELRGQLEVQAHELKLLQQQQITFYKDLDSRLAAAPTARPAPEKSTTVHSNVPSSQMNTTAIVVPTKTEKTSTPPAIEVSRINPADEQISYLAAYELVKNKRYDDAMNAMHLFVQKYPNGGYTANAEYWLGELYMVKKDYPKALEHFNSVLHKFPSSGKSAASQLKAGYAYAALGNNQEAKKQFQNVIKTYPGTPTANLARSKLDAINAL